MDNAEKLDFGKRNALETNLLVAMLVGFLDPGPAALLGFHASTGSGDIRYVLHLLFQYGVI